MKKMNMKKLISHEGLQTADFFSPEHEKAKWNTK